jgi:hypothetical protein
MIESLQDRFAPNTRCFGCGPANCTAVFVVVHEGHPAHNRWR